MNLKEPSPAHTPMEKLAAHQRAKQPIAPARLGRADSARNVSVPNEGTFTHSSDKRKGRVAQRSLSDKTDRNLSARPGDRGLPEAGPPL